MMKKILLTLLPLLFILTAKAQLTDSARSSNDRVHTSAEHVPEYPGGISEFNKFLKKYMRYPALARQNETEGKVLVTMVVEKDGSLSEVKVISGIGDNCDDEAVRLVKLSSPWKPGTQNGNHVRVQYTLPIVFDLSSQ